MLLAALALFGGCQRGQQVRVPRLEPPPKGIALDPPAPASLLWLRVVSAKIPARTSAGVDWDESGGLPDPRVALLIDGEEAFRTSTVTDSLTPVWAGGPSGTFEFRSGRRIVVQLSDDDGLRSQPIGDVELPEPEPEVQAAGFIDLDIGPSAQVRIALRTPPALFGLGMTFRFMAGKCHVTSRFEHGPAGRAGLEVGDRIDTIGGRPVAEMSSGAVRSAFLSVPMNGLQLQVVHSGAGTTETVQLPEGPIYPLYSEQDLVH